MSRKIAIIIALVLSIILLFFFLFSGKYFRKNDKVVHEKFVFEVAVMVNDQWHADTEKNIRDSLKAGDVLVVMPEGHNWSNTEKRSYLILKMKLTEEQKEKLLAKDITENKTLAQDRKNEELLVNRQRLYRIDLEKISFDKALFYEKNNLYKNKVFDWGIVEKKKSK